LTISTFGVTRIPSGDGQFWDIQDTSVWAQDSGGIATGGRAYPFNGFGYLKLQVRDGDGNLIVQNHYLRGFGLAHDGAERFDSTTPVLDGGIVIARSIFCAEGYNLSALFRQLRERDLAGTHGGGGMGRCSRSI
jgi:hypothetical protein